MHSFLARITNLRYLTNIAHPPENDNLLKTLGTFLDGFPKDFSIFDKIIQNTFVQNFY